VRISIDDRTYLLGVGLDISERMRAEAESARLQALLRSVILQSPVPMVLVLPDGTVELFNDGCRSVLGVAEGFQLPPDLNLFALEKTWIDYTAEGVRVPLEELPLTLALQGKTTRSREMRIVRQDGTERWILVDAVPVLDAHGTVIAGFLVFVDNTERKRDEEALTASQEFLSSIIENIPNMIFIKDAKELRFTRFNKAGEKLLGHSREELIGKNDYDFFIKEQADFFTKMDREVLESGQVLDIPEEAMDTAAGRRILHTKKIPLMDRRGKPAYLLGISEDITERVKAEEALRTSEANLQLVFEAGGLGDWNWDMVTGEVHWSDRCKALYGVPPELEMTYDRFLELVHPEDRARVDAALRQAVATKGDYNVEKRIIWPEPKP
jgi:PAS domain S-box-containing protein